MKMMWPLTVEGEGTAISLLHRGADPIGEPFMNHYIHHETTHLYAHCPVQPRFAWLRLVA